jgi:hypothetical protein
MKRNRSVFSWLAILLVCVFSLLAAIAPAQSTTPTSPTIASAAPPTFKLDSDLYTLNAPSTVLTQGTTGTGTGASPWSGAFFWDIRSSKLDAVAVNKILDLTKNTKLSGFSLYGFAGTTVDKDGKAVAGLAIGKEWKWFDQVSFFTAVGVSFSASTPIGGGIIVGASVKF